MCCARLLVRNAFAFGKNSSVERGANSRAPGPRQEAGAGERAAQRAANRSSNAARKSSEGAAGRAAALKQGAPPAAALALQGRAAGCGGNAESRTVCMGVQVRKAWVSASLGAAGGGAAAAVFQVLLSLAPHKSGVKGASKRPERALDRPRAHPARPGAPAAARAAPAVCWGLRLGAECRARACGGRGSRFAVRERRNHDMATAHAC